MIYMPSDVGEGCLLLIAGRVRVFHLTPDGKQSILAFLEPGELFGELAVCGPGLRDDFAEAAETSTVALLPGDALRLLIADNPTFALGITRLIGLRRRKIERRLRSLLFRSHRHRLLHLLLELAEQFGRPSARGTLISLALSHQELAGVIGSTRESVTLTLGDLQAEGLLVIARRRIELLSPQRMASEVTFTPLPNFPDAGSSPPADSRRPLAAYHG